MSEPGICSFCSDNIVRARVSWDFHHSSFSSLKSSANRRCVFCVLLYEDISRHRSVLEDFCTKDKSKDQTLKNWLHGGGSDAKTALYRWSVRSLGRTRESKLMVAVTFHVVPTIVETESDAQSQPKSQTFGLLERVFYCFPEADMEGLLHPVDVGASTNPEVNDGPQIKSWIRKCGIEHIHCPKRAGAGSRFVPTRLLDISGKHRGEPIRVVDTKADNIKGPYVTLSHCWGTLPGVRIDTLTLDTLHEFTTVGVPWRSLSRNFQEAIEVARFLEVDYIWIDSLCIIQGDRDDWVHEGALMHKVYRYSYCNIAAADARDSKGGLFRKRRPQHVLPARFEGDAASAVFGRRIWRTLSEDLWEQGLLKRPLYKRGWVFQERMLAPRILHFGEHQLFWDCAEMSACETLPAGLPLPLDRNSSSDRRWRGRLQEAGTSRSILLSAANDDSLEDFWKMAVQNYTDLDLTNQTDKRLAIWGIAKLIRDNLDEEYVAGLWQCGLEEQLAWRVADYAVAERPKELKTNPSWSWTSVKGQILVGNRLQRRDRVYRVTNHAGHAISFQIEDLNNRPEIPRKHSETTEDEIAAMGRDLELVEARRRKSSTASRQNSQGMIQISRQNSLGTAPVSRQNSQPDTRVDRATPIRKRMSQPVRKDSEAERQNKRDTESVLFDKRIAVSGYIHHGILRWENDRGSWTIEPTGTISCDDDDIVIDAFPDTKPDTEGKAIHFLVLVLSQQFKRQENLLAPDEPLPVQESWYHGHGIMLEPGENDQCYVRTGALEFRYISPQAWSDLQMKNERKDGPTQEPKAVTGMKFFLV